MTDIKHVVCTVPCEHCRASPKPGWEPGHYKQYGEIRPCFSCKGSCVVTKRVLLCEFVAALRAELAKPATPCGDPSCNDECAACRDHVPDTGGPVCRKCDKAACEC